jgi:hypothetical protein
MMFTILSFFCTAAHRSVQASHKVFSSIHLFTHPQHSRSALLRCAVWDLWFNNVCLRMQVRGPAHGMQGILEKQKTEAFAYPAPAGPGTGRTRQKECR